MIKQHLLGIALLATTSVATAQVDAIMQEGEFTIDNVGRADITITTSLNAQEWQGWMQIYGNAQHVMKRDMENSFSTYYVDDFAMDRKDSDREFTISMSAHGAAVYRGNDRWDMDLDKGIRARQLNDKQWLVQMTQDEGGALIQQDFTINLPEATVSSELATGELGQEVIRYVMPVEEGGGGSTMLYAGGGLGALGLLLLAVGLTRRNGPAVITVQQPAQIPAGSGSTGASSHAEQHDTERS
ncbi:MAG: hypothetical protein AAGH76_01290 [Pseudomonadota bacterium]